MKNPQERLQELKNEVYELCNQNDVRGVAELLSENYSEELNLYVDFLYEGAGINESTLFVSGGKIIGYEGNGDFTLDEPDYESRHFEIEIKPREELCSCGETVIIIEGKEGKAREIYGCKCHEVLNSCVCSCGEKVYYYGDKAYHIGCMGERK